METEFWTIWEAAKPYLTSEVTPALQYMVTGALARRQGTPLMASDLLAWLIPGLAALGIQAELLPLPPESDLSSLFSAYATLPVFSFSGPLDTELPETDDTNEEANAPEPAILRQGLAAVKGETGDLNINWRESDASEEAGTGERFRERFSHALHLQNSPQKGSRREQVQAACLRWLVYSDAYPDRIPTEAEDDAVARSQAAAFLYSSIGTRRDSVSNRLRWAAESYERGEVRQAIEFLRAGALQALALPAAVHAALLSDPTINALSDIQRRELIYLARAGTRDLKALSARRLTFEQHHPDVRQTLNQLRHDADAWVRAASKG